MDWVPAHTTLTVHIAVMGDADAAQDAADALLASTGGAVPMSRHGRRWRLSVCFDAEFAPVPNELGAGHR